MSAQPLLLFFFHVRITAIGHWIENNNDNNDELNQQKWYNASIHSSIFYTLLTQLGVKRVQPVGLEPNPDVIAWQAGNNLDRSPVHHRPTERQTTVQLTFTPTDNLDSPINLTCMCLDGGRKPEYPERSHTYTGRTCRLHTERTSRELNPLCCEASPDTMQPIKIRP